jgi:hypothetical protein
MNLQGENTWRVLLRASGNDAVLSRYRAELGSEVSGELEADSEAQLWGEMAAFSETASASAAGVMLVALSVPIASVTAAIKSCNEAASANGFSYAAIGRMGIGSILAAFSPASAISAEAYGGLISAVRRMLQPGASAVVLRCPTEVKRHLNVWGASPTDIDCMRAVKQAMDDKDILNRGRFLF